MKIQIINENDWEKTFRTSKSLIRVGSQVTCDVVLSDSDIQPLHLQILTAGGFQSPQMRVFAENVMLLRGDSAFPVKKLEPVGLLEGDKISLGSYRLIIHIENEQKRVRVLEHISAVLYFPNKELSPSTPLSGVLTLKNMGTEKSCQFRMRITGIPEECIQAAPVPFLYPGGVGTVGFTLRHLNTSPAPGFHTISVSVSAPEEYFGETLEFNQEIYVQPIFQTAFSLEDDSSLYQTKKSEKNDTKPMPEAVPYTDMSFSPGGVEKADTQKEEQPSVRVIKPGTQAAFTEAETEPQPEPETRAASRRRRKQNVRLVQHGERNLFSEEISEAPTQPGELPETKPAASDDVEDRSIPIVQPQNGFANSDEGAIAGQPKPETHPEPEKAAPGEQQDRNIPLVYSREDFPDSEAESSAGQSLPEILPEAAPKAEIAASGVQQDPKIQVIHSEEEFPDFEEESSAADQAQPQTLPEALSESEVRSSSRRRRKKNRRDILHREEDTPSAEAQEALMQPEPLREAVPEPKITVSGELKTMNIPVIHHQEEFPDSKDESSTLQMLPESRPESILESEMAAADDSEGGKVRVVRHPEAFADAEEEAIVVPSLPERLSEAGPESESHPSRRQRKKKEHRRLHREAVISSEEVSEPERAASGEQQEQYIPVLTADDVPRVLQDEKAPVENRMPEIRVIQSGASDQFIEEPEENAAPEAPREPVLVISGGDFVD